MGNLKDKLEGTLDQFTSCYIYGRYPESDAPATYCTSFCGLFLRVDDDARNIHMFEKSVLNY